MGFLKEAAKHGLKVDVKSYVLIWGGVAVVGLVLDHFFGCDLLLGLISMAHSRPS